jgi:hypothetical protein
MSNDYPWYLPLKNPVLAIKSYIDRQKAENKLYPENLRKSLDSGIFRAK